MYYSRRGKYRVYFNLFYLMVCQLGISVLCYGLFQGLWVDVSLSQKMVPQPFISWTSVLEQMGIFFFVSYKRNQTDSSVKGGISFVYLFLFSKSKKNKGCTNFFYLIPHKKSNNWFGLPDNENIMNITKLISWDQELDIMNISDDEQKIDVFTKGYHLYRCLRRICGLLFFWLTTKSTRVEDDDTFTVECNFLDFSICLARGLSTPQT